MRNHPELLETASVLAADGRLWAAADSLMAGFAELEEATDAPNGDSIGQPLHGFAPKLMDRAADYLDLLDSIEADSPDAIDTEVAATTPPRHLRWAQWHALNGHAEIRRGHPGRAVDHLELAAGLFGSDGLLGQEVPLLAQIAACQLECGDLPRAEDALNRALAARARNPTEADRFGQLLDDVAARIGERI